MYGTLKKSNCNTNNKFHKYPRYIIDRFAFPYIETIIVR